MSDHVHDFVAIGLGPFNLGLAALTDPIDDLDGVFLEARDGFDWHPGMMLPDATLQVPFMADLVTMADPTSAYSFLNFLKLTGRIYPFYIRENFLALRAEYNRYCQWVAGQLGSIHFGQRVTGVVHDGSAYVVTSATGQQWRGRRLVLGVGTQPWLPEPARDIQGSTPLLHSADYLARKAELQATSSITVLGSGQSAAEVYADLLADAPAHDYELTWATRSPRFFPMEYTKLTLEMTSPEYTAYYQRLDPATRQRLGREQRSLSKGISATLINEIFDLHYAHQVAGQLDTTLLTATEVRAITATERGYTLDLHHLEEDQPLRLETESLVLSTGYAASEPDFLTTIDDRLRRDAEGRLAADADYRIADDVFVQNLEEHTHGFVAPDLGMGAYRNSVIIAAMLGREVYPIEKRVAVQEFGVPDRLRVQT